MNLIKLFKDGGLKMRRFFSGIVSLCIASSMISQVFAEGDILKGDVNADGIISVADIVSMKKYLLGAEVRTEREAADINSDGNINIIDMIHLMEMFTGETAAKPSVAEVNENAGNIYSTAVMAVRYLSGTGETFEDGIYTSDDKSELTGLIEKNADIPSGTRWCISLKDSVVTECLCETGGVTGAYPNEIPQMMNADYDKVKSEDLMDIYTDWKTAYPEFMSENSSLSEYPKISTEEMNQKAYDIFSAVSMYKTVTKYKGDEFDELAGKTGIFSGEDLSEKFRDGIYRLSGLNPANSEFIISVKDGDVDGCICTDSEGKITGSYPNAVPQTMNVPFSSEYAEYAVQKTFNWKTEMPQFISDDPIQSSLPDYPERSVSDYNSAARKIFREVQYIAQELETQGTELKDGVYTQDSEEFLELSMPEMKFAVLIENYIVEACIVSNDDFVRSGAYPNSIPQSMNIPFDSEYLKDASDFYTDWKMKYPEFISEDPVQAALPDYPFKPVLEYNKISKILFSIIQTLIQEYETKGIDVKNGIYTDEDELCSEFRSREYHFSVLIEDYVVKGVAVGDEISTGTYPNKMPNSIIMPFDEKLANDAADSNVDWENSYSEFVSHDLNVIANRYNLCFALPLALNSSARAVFTNAQTIAQEYETRGMNVDGVYSSTDSCDYVKDVQNCLTGEYEWVVKVENSVVTGACVKDKNSSNMGAYPNKVPNYLIVEYSGYNELCEKNADNEKWNEIGHEWFWYDFIR